MKTRHYASSEDIINRDNEVEHVKNLLCRSDKSQVHIIFSQSGYGKTSFSTKLARESYFADWEVVRVETKPKNTNSITPEGEYLDLIFNTLKKHFERNGHSNLLFENYLIQGKNKFVNNLAIDDSINRLSLIDTRKKVLGSLFGIFAKRLMQTGVYSPYTFIYDDSMKARSIKAEYVRFLFERTRILLIIENIQNIDNMSYKYLLDWVSDTKNCKHGFIMEYTLTEINSKCKMKTFCQSFVKTGADVYESELEKISPEYIADIIESQLDDRPTDIHFTIRAQRHYNELSDGNLWDLLDFARVYDSKQCNDVPSPTLAILNELSYEAKYLVSILAYHNGEMDKSLLHHIWLKRFSNEPESYLNALYKELEKASTVKFSKSEVEIQISLSHASILDVWQGAQDFAAINKEVYKRLKEFYQASYDGRINGQSKLFAWQMLLCLYATHQPDKIMDLIDDLKINIIHTISRDNAWNYLKVLITHTQKRIAALEDVYFEILQICLSASLYTEGYSCIKLMEQQLDINENNKLLLNKLLYLSILDRHHDVIEIYKHALEKTSLYSKTWINLKLLVLNSYIALGDEASCLHIHREITAMPELKKMDEYAIFLRLTNIYLRPSQAVKNARKSFKLFQKRGNCKQEGKSLITYSKLLSSLGKHKKAIHTIKRAESLLRGQNEGMSCIFNNLAGYHLLSGEYGPEIWRYLDDAEIYSVSTYDRLSVVLNKLAWCYENRAFDRLDLLENKALELIELEPSQFIHCTTYYNLQLVMRTAGEENKAKKYYELAEALKEKCSYVKARMDGITRKTRYIKLLIKQPYHICYLSFWVFDIEW